jgi:hypothetical protein
MMDVEYKLVVFLNNLGCISDDVAIKAVNSWAAPWDDAEWCARGCP